MQESSHLLWVFAIYIFIVLYIYFYDENNLIYQYLKTCSLSNLMTQIKQNTELYALGSIIFCVLFAFYISKTQNTLEKPLILGFLFIVSMLYVAFYNASYPFYKKMETIFDPLLLPKLKEKYETIYFVCMPILGWILIASLYYDYVTKDGRKKISYFSAKLTGLTLGILCCLVLFFSILRFLQSKKMQWIVLCVVALLSTIVFFYVSSSSSSSSKSNIGTDDDNGGGTVLKLCSAYFFYLPCLFTDIQKYILAEYNQSEKSHLYVIGGTTFLVFLYMVVPLFQKYIHHVKGKQLLSLPLAINKYTNIASYEDLSGNTNAENGITSYHYSYGISFWFFIETQSPSNSANYFKYTSIFNYGNKPNLLYNAHENKLLLKMKNGQIGEKKIFIKDTVQLQKWNHVVINYDAGTLDIFINNKLVGTKIKVVPFMTHDVVSLGEKDGIHGGICNIKYTDHILTKYDITNIYESLKTIEPPVL